MSREQRSSKEYVRIVSNKDLGTVSLRQEVPEGTEGAEIRKWHVGDKKGTKYEIPYTALSGIVKNIEIKTSTFDDKVTVRNLYVTLEDDKGEIVITDKTTNRFALDIMKKLPNMDFSKVYRFSPFYFTGDTGKPIKGVLISEGDSYEKDSSVKIESFFAFDEKKKEYANGYPMPKKAYDEMTENQKKSYYGEVEDFLVEYTEKNIIPKFVGESGDDKDLEEDAIDKF